MASTRAGSTAALPVLIVDDDLPTIEFLTEALDGLPLQLQTASTAEDAIASVRRHLPRLVFLDLLMPGVTGFDLMDRILATDPTIDVILATGVYSTESAVEAIQRGALDYLVKPLRVERLRCVAERWIDNVQGLRRSDDLEAELARASVQAGIVGRSAPMLEIISTIQRIAPHYETALITGDTGTGKELIARALHDFSPVASGPFVACNSAAMSETLVESELFGYVRGAFTGAMQDKPGLVEAANNGTLFLDEIGEISPATQAKLLRFLQEREVRRLGANVTRRVNVRLVAATNRNLRDMVRDGTFREDLYYRLGTVQVRLPRLADRKEDLPLLIRHFLERNAQRLGRRSLALSRKANAVLTSFEWPGNVRELESALAYACMMAQTDLIDVRDLPAWLTDTDGFEKQERGDDRLISLEEAERRHAMFVLGEVGGNRSRAAEILKISRATLYRLVPPENRKSDKP